MREELAALAHDQWAGWMRYLFDLSRDNPDGTITVPSKLVERWRRQMATPYAQLPPNEQDSDRVEANRVLAVLSTYVKLEVLEMEVQNAIEARLQSGNNQPEHS
jgi:hypothetical protein